MYSYRSDLGFWIMKNRYKNPHLEIHTSGIYCLPGNRVGILLADLVLTSVLSPPPPPTSPLNTTTHYSKTTFRVLVVLTRLYPHIHFGSLWVFVVTFGFGIHVNHGVRKRVSELNRHSVYLLFYICEKHETSG